MGRAACPPTTLRVNIDYRENGGGVANVEALPSARRVRWSVDVDPQEMI